MKVLVSDFDGVFFTEDYEKNIKLVNKFVDQGNIFVLATGRNIADLRKDMNDHFIKCSYFLCNDGATIFDQFMNIIYRKDIEPKIVRIMYNALSSVSCVADVFLDNSTAYMFDVNRPTNKIVGRIANQDKCLELADKINQFYPEVYAYVSRHWINITNRSETKLTAINFLEKYYNFDNYDIYAIGNGVNDMCFAKMDNGYVLSSAYITVKKEFKNTIDSFEDMVNMLLNN